MREQNVKPARTRGTERGLSLVFLVFVIIIPIFVVSCVATPTKNEVNLSTGGNEALPVKGEGFTDPKVCRSCHADQYSQWLGSMHRYAQASITNELVNDFLLKRTGQTIGPFCIRCHTPIGTEMGEPYGMPNEERSAISMTGVSCDVCHSVTKLHGSAQAFFKLNPSNTVYGPHGKGNEKDPVSQTVDFHGAQQSDLFKKSEFCQQCHEVVVPNGLRLQETYSEWKASPWAAEGVTCQSCHMGQIPGRPSERPMGEIAEVPGLDLPKRPLSNHSFIGVDVHWTDDYPLRGKDGKAPSSIQKDHNVKLQDEIVEKRKELMRNAAKLHITAPTFLMPGERGTLQVKIENTFSGHHFPSGFPWRQAWVEVQYTDTNGKTFFKSGDVDHNGDIRNTFSRDVNEGKMKEDPYLVNLSTRITVRGFRGNDVEVAFPLAEEDAPAPTVFPASSPQSVYNGAETARMVKRGIPARGTRSFSYPIEVPETISGPITYNVRLLYRNFPPYYLDYFKRYYPQHKELLDTMKGKLQTYEVDAKVGEINTSVK